MILNRKSLGYGLLVRQNNLCVLIISFTLKTPVLGTYIRTSDGRIFAIRAANKAKTAEESTTAPPKGKMSHYQN